MSNSFDDILSSALALVRAGDAVSLESAAKAAGLTKPGLMYHFRTKEALMIALVDRVADAWFEEMESRLSTPREDASPLDRVAIYLETVLDKDADPADIVMLTDPRLREVLIARWADRIAPWFDGIDNLPIEKRGLLSAVRLMADGVWFGKATGTHVPDNSERSTILASAHEIMKKAKA